MLAALFYPAALKPASSGGGLGGLFGIIGGGLANAATGGLVSDPSTGIGTGAGTGTAPAQPNRGTLVDGAAPTSQLGTLVGTLGTTA